MCLCHAIHYLFSHDLEYLAAWPEASSSQLFIRIQKRNIKLLETVKMFTDFVERILLFL